MQMLTWNARNALHSRASAVRLLSRYPRVVPSGHLRRTLPAARRANRNSYNNSYIRTAIFPLSFFLPPFASTYSPFSTSIRFCSLPSTTTLD
jgi:hypothetical protein